MHKRSSKRSDPNLTAFDIVSQAIGEDQPKRKPQEPEKNPAAVALGRLGGLKGGPARKKALTKKRRKEIAQEAAKTRWSKSKV
jgi:hypothetical protein